MDFCIEDTRKKTIPSIKQLINDGIITLDDVTDWLRSIYEIRFFEEKVYDLLGENIIKGRIASLRGPGSRSGWRYCRD